CRRRNKPEIVTGGLAGHVELESRPKLTHPPHIKIDQERVLNNGSRVEWRLGHNLQAGVENIDGQGPVVAPIDLLHFVPLGGGSREARTQVDEIVELLATVLENFQKSGVPVNNGQRAEPQTRPRGGLRLVKKPLGISRCVTAGTKCQRPARTN